MAERDTSEHRPRRSRCPLRRRPEGPAHCRGYCQTTLEVMSKRPPRARQRSGGRPSIPILQGDQGMDSTLTVPKQGAVCAIYARKSTDDSDRSDEARSTARQIARATDYATAKGWTVDLRYI